MIVAIGAGIVFGLVAPEAAKKSQWLADAFIQLIKTVTGPVIFVTVVIGISSLGSLSKAGGLALRALGYFFVMTVIALALGLIVGNVVARIGAGRAADGGGRRQGQGGDRRGGDRLRHRRVHHQRPAADELPAAVRGQQDPPGARARDPHRGGDHFLADDVRTRIIGGFEVRQSKVIFGIIRLIMWAAPLGAFGGMAFTVAQFGSGALANLGLLAVTFWATCAFFVFVILGTVGASRGSASSASSG